MLIIEKSSLLQITVTSIIAQGEKEDKHFILDILPHGQYGLWQTVMLPRSSNSEVSEQKVVKKDLKKVCL